MHFQVIRVIKINFIDRLNKAKRPKVLEKFFVPVRNCANNLATLTNCPEIIDFSQFNPILPGRVFGTTLEVFCP